MTDSYGDNLHKGAIGKLFEYSRELRQVSTEAEKLLWSELRNRKLNGLKFRRQHPVDKYVADFYCHEKRLVIELDGVVHDKKENKEYDQARTIELAGLKINVLRFRNDEVENDIEKVLTKIIQKAESIETEW
ncbi:MAG: endonuclease domain-containing protein [Bacteroidetes bacterium]|nr:endonuclease domain-containing protein [Bacteroidota bacterium]MBS1607818.1 endonuclease domain-containing protein [Bacteroidota bacterium]